MRGGGVTDEGKGEVVVEEGNGDGQEGEGVEVVDPTPCPSPLPQRLFNALGPQSATARKAGTIPRSAQVLEPGCTGDRRAGGFFLSPA